MDDVSRRCPPIESIAALVDGRLQGEEQRRVVDHLSRCRECHELFSEAVRFQEEEAERSSPSVVTLRSRSWIPVAAAAMVTIGLASVLGLALWRSRNGGSAGLISAANALPNRPTLGRLSGDFEWAPAPAVARGADDRSTPERLRLLGAAGELLGDDSTDGRLRGVAELLAGDEEKAIQALVDQTTRAPGDAAAWSDLSAAYVQRAVEIDSPATALKGLAAADRALQRDANNQPALFNRAIALEQLGMLVEARAAWKRYLEVDSTSKWAEEARDRLRRVSLTHDTALWKETIPRLLSASAAGDTAGVTSIVRRFPQEARTWGEGVFLSDWAENFSDDPEEAARRLTAARLIGDALRETSGETLLADAVRSVDTALATADTKRIEVLRSGQLAYRGGRISLSRGKISEAEKELNDAEALLRRADTPIASLARYFALGAQMETPDALAALAPYLEMERSAAKAGYKALRAQIAWHVALLHHIAGNSQEAVAQYQSALALFKALGETENVAAIEARLASVIELRGDVDGAWRHRRSALHILSVFGRDFARLSALESGINGTVTRGDWGESWSLANLSLEAASRLERQEFVSDALLYRSVAGRHLGDLRQADHDLAAALETAKKIEDLSLRERAEADLRFAEAVAHSDRDPARSLESIRKAAAFFELRGYRFLEPRLLFEQGKLQRKLRDQAAARESFAKAVRSLEAQRAVITEPTAKARMFEVAVDDIIAEAIALELSEGRPRGAFMLAESSRARTLHELVSTGSFEPYIPEQIQKALSPDTALVSFYTLPGSALVQVIRNSGMTTIQIPAGSAQLERAVGKAREAILTRSDEIARKELAALDALLMKPIERELSSIRHLVIVSDRSLDALPFHALFDERRGKFRLESTAFSYAPSAAIFLACSARTAARGGSALVVGNPRFDPVRYSKLPPLPAAELEARAVARLGRTVLLTRESATRANFVRGLADNSLVYFAGHSVSDEIEPSRSAIILAGSTDAALTTGEIARLRLDHSPLVVLSACRSGSRSGSTYDGVGSIARAFLVAGAPAVIAAGWDVDDTANAAMLPELRSQLDAGMTPVNALQHVQLKALRQGGTAGLIRNWASMHLIGGESSAVATKQKDGRKKA
jgi:CHAT domain-containing protein